MATDTKTSIRLYVRDMDGSMSDDGQTFDLDTFAGILPAVGDTILDPGVWEHLDRSLPENRTVWKVLERVFNPKDLNDYVVLVVEERPATRLDAWAY